jgi:hypothetical protein
MTRAIALRDSSCRSEFHTGRVQSAYVMLRVCDRNGNAVLLAGELIGVDFGTGGR